MTRALGILGLVLSWSLAALAAEPWTLERALQQALSANPDARLAQQRIVAAQAGLDQANAAFWPRVQFQSSYTGSDNPMLAFGSILNQRAYSSSLNFNDVPTRGRPQRAGPGHRAALRGRQEHGHAQSGQREYRSRPAGQCRRPQRARLRGVPRLLHGAQDAAIHPGRRSGGQFLRGEPGGGEEAPRRRHAAEEPACWTSRSGWRRRARNSSAPATRMRWRCARCATCWASRAASSRSPTRRPPTQAPDSGDFSGRPELAAARHRERAAQEQVTRRQRRLPPARQRLRQPGL